MHSRLTVAACSIAFTALMAVAAPARAEDAKPAGGESDRTFAGHVTPFLAKYCNNCHGDAKPKADLNLLSFTDEGSVVRARKLWGRLKDYLQSGEMPPEKHPQPSQEEIDKISAWIDATLSKVDCTSQADPGRVTIRRLNRSEYNNTVRDLIGVDFRPADDFPSDDVGGGFDNLGDVLTLPPVLFEKYLAAAETIAGQAIAAGTTGSVTKTWEAENLPDSAGGAPYKESARLLSTVGEVRTTFNVTREGDYLLRARVFEQKAGPDHSRMDLTVDGKPVASFEVRAVESAPQVCEQKVRLAPGDHAVAAAFLNDWWDGSLPESAERDRNLAVDALEAYGPVSTAGAVLPESHKRIIFETPNSENRDEVAARVIERFATRAFRRQVAGGEVARLAKFVTLAMENGDSFETGIQLAVEAVLVSPHFLYRVEIDRRPRDNKKDKAKLGEPFAINDEELASRLSYFLWSSMPDDELLGLALAKKLRQPEVLDAQARRMLKDPKAQALVENFGDQWLQIRNLKTASPDRGQFPGFNDTLRDSMLRETELFLAAVIREDRSVLDLIDADFTYLDEPLARHYGISGVTGPGFRRVSLAGTDGMRGGVLTQASVLTVTSNATRTSPVKRGKWILEQILGTPPPAAPPDVPELADNKEGAILVGTLRQRMEQHRADPGCASCHNRMDPLGFGFENYDAVGASRRLDGGSPIDPSGVLPGGATFQGPKELKAILKARGKEFAHCLAEKMTTFALGRGVDYYDACAIDKIVEAMSQRDYRFSELVVEIVKSEPFLKRRGKEGVTR